MDKHDFTGKRAKEQWEAQELVRKRKKEQSNYGQSKISKQDEAISPKTNDNTANNLERDNTERE